MAIVTPNVANALRRNIEPARQATMPTPVTRAPVAVSQRGYRRGGTRQGGYRR